MCSLFDIIRQPLDRRGFPLLFLEFSLLSASPLGSDVRYGQWSAQLRTEATGNSLPGRFLSLLYTVELTLYILDLYLWQCKSTFSFD